MFASLVGYLGDFDLAEEAAREAFAVAAERWARDGVPANPGAWLTVTARNWWTLRHGWASIGAAEVPRCA